MKVIQAPERVDWKIPVTIFLAGSIEMGAASDWQQEAIELFEELTPQKLKSKYQILNPRRDDWDDSVINDFTDPVFSQQVIWELRGLREADMVLMYFDPGTLSPISLLELGAFSSKVVVVCPEGYDRKGNVDIFCDQFRVTQQPTLKDAIKNILKRTKSRAGYKYDY